MRALLLAASIALSSALPAYAGNLLDMHVVDRDTGVTLPTWMSNGKLYVAGKPGHRYAVRLSNRTGARVMAVLSVDGVNAVSGETAGADQNGYVLDAWQSTEINGWRKSLDEVAQFNFTTLSNSYAAQTGRPANVGVIGVAVFTEHRPKPRPKDRIGIASSPPSSPAPNESIEERESSASGTDSVAGRSSSASPRSADAMARKRESRSERLGTGHGEREWSRLATTTFQRASSRPTEQIAIWYDSYANLAARGIVPRRPLASAEPNPFPNGFVADPPYRRR